MNKDNKQVIIHIVIHSNSRPTRFEILNDYLLLKGYDSAWENDEHDKILGIRIKCSPDQFNNFFENIKPAFFADFEGKEIYQFLGEPIDRFDHLYVSDSRNGIPNIYRAEVLPNDFNDNLVHIKIFNEKDEVFGFAKFNPKYPINDYTVLYRSGPEQIRMIPVTPYTDGIYRAL